MKCVKNLETGVITRVKDDNAYLLVGTGKYVYSNKQAWKDAGRK